MSTATVDRLLASMRTSRGFPTMESTANTVLASLMGEKRRPPDVSAKIVEDFALTQKVLQLANSAMYAPFASGSTSVSSAMQVLGSDALLHLVLGTDLVSDDDLQQDALLSRSHLAAELARDTLSERSEDVSIATYLCDLGRMLAGKYLPDEVAAIEAKVQAGMAQDAAAQQVLGMSLEQLGMQVAQLWRLPMPLLQTMDGTGDPTLVGVAKFSNQASRLLQEGATDEVQQLVSRLDLPGIDRHRLAHLVEQKAATVVPRIPPSERAGHSAEKSLRDLFAQLTRDRLATVDELAQAMFASIAPLLNISYSLLFMLTRSGEFAVRNGYGRHIDTIKGKLRVSAEFKPTAFHAVVRNNVDVSISDVGKLKASALPDGFRDLFPKTVQFVILPVGAGRTTGLLYCGWDVHKPLSQDEMLALKQLRDLFVPFFPR